MHGAVEGHLEVADLLLKAGVDKDAADEDGETALHWAVRSGHSEVVTRLLEAGADKAVADSDGKLPSDVALDFKNIEVFNLLQAWR